VTGNNLVKRSVNFTPYTTDRIRITVNNALNGYSRITEVEAWGVNAANETNVALASNGAVATASSAYSAAYPVAAINNNERAGVNWGNGGGWNVRNLLTMQFDGNLCLYDDSGNAAWCSHTSPASPQQAIMQTDGNLCVYFADQGSWCSGTAGHPGSYLEVQDNGKVVIYDQATALWTVP
jgi:hypothetical protein